MAEGNFYNLYFINFDSDDKFEGFDPENITPLWWV